MHRRRQQLMVGIWSALLITVGLFSRAQSAEQTRVKDVIYGFKEGVALTMDVFKPANPNGIGVLWMVSGAWISSHDEGPNFASINPDIAKLFTSRGETVFEIVHGTQPRFPVGDIVKDIRRAVRYVRFHAAEYGVDPNKLGISGGSSGGHLSLITASLGDGGDPSSKDPVERVSSRLQAVACFFPPTDFLNWGKTGVRAFEVPLLAPFRPAFGVSATATDDDKVKLATALSPIYHITEKMPPTLIIHGGADPVVPLQQSQIFCAKLDELKVPNKLEVRPGKGHGWTDVGPDFAMFADWYDKYLGGAK